MQGVEILFRAEKEAIEKMAKVLGFLRRGRVCSDMGCLRWTCTWLFDLIHVHIFDFWSGRVVQRCQYGGARLGGIYFGMNTQI